jgi:hypothetical protein
VQIQNAALFHRASDIQPVSVWELYIHKDRKNKSTAIIDIAVLSLNISSDRAKYNHPSLLFRHRLNIVLNSPSQSPHRGSRRIYMSCRSAADSSGFPIRSHQNRNHLPKSRPLKYSPSGLDCNNYPDR